MTFFKNLKEAKSLDQQIQLDRSELHIIQNNFARYFYKHSYALVILLLGSFLIGAVASFFLKTARLLKIANSSFVRAARTALSALPIVI